MKIALIGHGKMGRLIESLAAEKGHAIFVIDKNAPLAETLRDVDVAIDFTVADAVRGNVEACVLAGIPVVVGTTGWNEQRAEIEKLVQDNNGAMVYGANFSIGVDLFYRVAEYAASLVKNFPEYEAFIEEQHHSRKKDAPSGTALKLQEIVSAELFPESADKGVRVPIAATRAGNIPGTHRLGFDGPSDQILIQHTARDREGFALGAISAAEWIADKKGFFEFSQVIDSIL